MSVTFALDQLQSRSARPPTLPLRGVVRALTLQQAWMMPAEPLATL